MNTLKDLAELKDSWDGNGALAFSKTLIDRVQNEIDKLSVPYELFPTYRQSIQIEYHIDGCYYEMEIFENGNIEYYLDAD